MKNTMKILALIISIAMIMALCSLFTTAVTPPGDINITWDPDADFEFDGDISEWEDYEFTKFTVENFAPFSNHPAPPDDFEINAYFVADADFLYVAFWIKDNTIVKGPGINDDGKLNAADYAGDAFQIAIDFNCAMEEGLDAGNADYGNNKNIFYSFGLNEEGTDFYIVRQESYNDVILTEANGDAIKGATGDYEGGWCAEFALGWQMLYDDFNFKTMEEDYTAEFNEDSPFSLGITLCYLDRLGEVFVNDSVSAKTTAGYGTFDKENATWTPQDNGIHLILNYEEGIKLNCTGITTSAGSEDTDTTTEETTEVTTEETTEVTTEETTEVTTEETTEVTTEETTVADTTVADTTAADTTAADTTAADTTAATTDAATTVAPAKGGCGSVVGSAVAVAVIAMAGAVAVVLKKRD